MRRATIILIVAVVVAVICVYSYFVDTRGMAFAPKCVFFQWTGYKCPGCGTQRALHELMHGHLQGAFAYNPLLFAAVPYAGLLAWLRYGDGSRRCPKLDRAVFSQRGVMAVFWLLVGYWVLRNVAGF